ncbi:MAG: nucleotidyl transferase AbiEii/AbiGii toxin family protein [Clostridia bacterium]|nr:nucleotidyl transferase AbiEii/AbiGii toxin family protein [Clostridia bacterium]
MATIREMIRQANAEGFIGDNAEAKVCQDIVLIALSKSPLSRNATIKGGVVMRSISNDARRATQDMDIDFIRYSLGDAAIMRFIQQLNCLDGIHISQTGSITELRQQDYHGKRVFVTISDDTGDTIESKIDLGVHKNLSIEQEEYCFDISFYEGSACLLINSKEQMFTEKLRSLLKFGPNSTRYKDIFDMYYLSGLLDAPKLIKCIEVFVFSDTGMRENNFEDIVKRVRSTFSSRRYIDRLTTSKKNWLGEETSTITNTLVEFLTKLDTY